MENISEYISQLALNMIHGTGRGGNIVFINSVATNTNRKFVLFLTKYLRIYREVYSIRELFRFELNNLFFVDKKCYKGRGKYDGLCRSVINLFPKSVQLRPRQR